jgi:hypothetical protein
MNKDQDDIYFGEILKQYPLSDYEKDTMISSKDEAYRSYGERNAEAIWVAKKICDLWLKQSKPS